MLKPIKINFSDGYFCGLLLLAIGLPFSNFLMSVSQFVLLGFWLMEGNHKEKLSRFLSNKVALVIGGVFVLHIIGLSYTSDFTYGFEDIRKKIPLLLLPLLLSTIKPLPVRRFQVVLIVFCSAVFVGTVFSTFILIGFTGKEIIDIRQISVFVSHIRFSLMICFAAFLCFYFSFKPEYKRYKYLFLVIAIWYVTFLGIMESLTGAITFVAVLASLLIRQVFISPKPKLQLMFSFLVFSIIAIIISYLTLEVNAYENSKKNINSEVYGASPLGEKYDHNFSNFEVENNNYIWRNIAWKELSNAWERKSNIPFNGRDLKGNNINQTIIRFLTSKGLNKDAKGISSLSNDEISAIERGVSNVDFQDASNLRNRVRMVIWEIDHYITGNNPNGHSITMRLEFWKAACGIVKDNLLIGVGTGDVKLEFGLQYDKMNSPLNEQWRLRAHNQYLEIAVGFGVLGLVYFLFSLIYPLSVKALRFEFYYFVFLVISLTSMINEDTLETQAGVTFFSFFNSLLIFGRELRMKE